MKNVPPYKSHLSGTESVPKGNLKLKKLKIFLAPVCLIHFPRVRHFATQRSPTSPLLNPYCSFHMQKGSPFSFFFIKMGEKREKKSFQQDVKSHTHFTLCRFKEWKFFPYVIFWCSNNTFGFLTWVWGKKKRKIKTNVFCFKAFYAILKRYLSGGEIARRWNIHVSLICDVYVKKKRN